MKTKLNLLVYGVNNFAPTKILYRSTLVKYLLCFLFCISTGIGISQNTYIPDDNFEQALINLGYDSGPIDDYVPTSNINSITDLNIFNKNISDLTGIEDFTSLKVLDCGSNNLT